MLQSLSMYFQMPFLAKDINYSKPKNPLQSINSDKQKLNLFAFCLFTTRYIRNHVFILLPFYFFPKGSNTLLYSFLDDFPFQHDLFVWIVF